MKNKKILLIVLIVIILLLIVSGGIVFAYFTTDFLKTNEQLFYKYISQISLEDFKSEKLDNYLEKVQNSKYENSGKITAEVTMPEEMRR